MSEPVVALTVAGADPAGGAGVAADLRTFAALGAHGTFALTVVTAQDTTAVHRAQPLTADLVVDQIAAVTGDLPVAASKTGLLLDPVTVDAVADVAASGRLPGLVVDPVLADRYGRPLGGDELVTAYRERLLPRAAVATPNVHEARLLTGLPVGDVAGMVEAARALVDLGVGAGVVTGGALTGADVVDVIWYSGDVTELRRPRLATVNDHGSGDSLSAALAVALVDATISPVDATRRAVDFVANALRGAAGWRIGAGHGPLDQLGWQQR
ncbi:MAG: bifunctional hydroxymethylpyrimidine kinase/phosphomethylpyrimidine kinase [Actinomycetota bacterium]